MAQLIDGKAIADRQLGELKNSIGQFQRCWLNFQPGLAIVQVGNRADSNVYIRNKLRAAQQIGLQARHVKLPSSADQLSVIACVQNLNNDEGVHGIIVQLPMDSQNKIDAEEVVNTIAPSKDVDGLTLLNAGKLARGELDSNTIVPCTPQACLELLKSVDVDVTGKHCVVIGRSKIVGGPASSLLLWNNATVTTCHSKTKNLPDICRLADVLLVAIGKANMIKGSWLKPGVVIIDCGINAVEGAARKLCGDVDFQEAVRVASFITPVPGGVGPMTVAMLMKNTLQACVNRFQLDKCWQLPTRVLEISTPVPSDVAISKSCPAVEIAYIAQSIGVRKDEMELYGKYKAKLSLKLLDRLKSSQQGKYVLVTSMTPNAAGVGKSTVTIGLAQALNAHCNVNAIACVRQPSIGPTFGIKGGAAGGGYSQVIPTDEFNLHLTGDIHAVAIATNLLVAAIDTRIFHEMTLSTDNLFTRLVTSKDGTVSFCPVQKWRLKKLNIDKCHPDELSQKEREQFARLNIDPSTINVNRVVDVNDRLLRLVTIGQACSERGVHRQCKFDIAAASELMAILSLSTSVSELRARVGRMLVAFDTSGNAVTADDLGVTGGLLALLKDSLKPTLMQTIECSPVLVHTGPFANISHGNSSILADLMALKLVGPNGLVITEAGFGADVGFEKFINIKVQTLGDFRVQVHPEAFQCRASGLRPDAVVLVVTVDALKNQGLGAKSTTDSLAMVESGCSNMARHVAIVKMFNLNVVVVVNRFDNDTEEELALIKKQAIMAGASDFSVVTNWSRGGRGALDLATKLLHQRVPATGNLNYLYELDESLEAKIERIAQEIYGAACLNFSTEAQEEIEILKKHSLDNLPICMAKTPLSLSMNPKWLGVPQGYELPIRQVKACTGAGYIYVIVGDVQTMPGLPVRPAFYDMSTEEASEEVSEIC